MSSVSVPKKNIPKKNTSRNLVYSYYANFANLHFYWQLNSVIAITFSCIDSIDCSPFSRNPPHHPPAASLIATECTADILWEKGVERETYWSGNSPPSNNQSHWSPVTLSVFLLLSNIHIKVKTNQLLSSERNGEQAIAAGAAGPNITLWLSPQSYQDLNNCPSLFWHLPQDLGP